MDFSGELIARSGYDRPGFAAQYDRFRPRTPRPLLEVLCRYAHVETPALVVDLGCGTGLSTRVWSGVAERVVGIEPDPEMLAAAERAPAVEYREAFAHDTGLAGGVADIVTCSQSHWMEPEPTFAEIARILRPGGVLAAYDYDWPRSSIPKWTKRSRRTRGAGGRRATRVASNAEPTGGRRRSTSSGGVSARDGDHRVAGDEAVRFVERACRGRGSASLPFF